LATVGLAGCKSEPLATPQGEAPMISKRVSTGDLPPLAERIPADAMLVTTVAGPGNYGGTLRFVDREPRAWSSHLLRQSGLLRYDMDGQETQPDLAKDVRLSDDLKTLTVELRAGHRWSDGAPFTTADILFWWEAYAIHPEFSPDSFWTFDEGEVRLEVASETLAHFHFPIPYPVVLDRWGRAYFSSDGPYGPMLPKHYMAALHQDFDEGARDLAKEKGFERWQDYFQSQVGPLNMTSKERPSLTPWVLEKTIVDGAVYVRNPYFHQVDEAGNQLPYLDYVSVSYLTDRDRFLEGITSGEADFEAYFLDQSDAATLDAGLVDGDYKIRTAVGLHGSAFTIHPNRSVDDPLLRALFEAKDFRVALSLGIDREGIVADVYGGQAQPFPALPLPSNPYFREEWRDLYMAHDPAAANALLDGLVTDIRTRDEEGYRLTPEGERLQLRMQMLKTLEINRSICERISADWTALGIELKCMGMGMGNFKDEFEENDLSMPVWSTGRATRLGRSDLRTFGFDDPSQQYWASQWALWFQSEGEEGEEPPQEIKDLAALGERWRATAYGSKDYVELGRAYFGYFAEELPMIGTVGLEVQPILVANRLRNVPQVNLRWGSDNNFYAPYLPAQWWVDDPESALASAQATILPTATRAATQTPVP
jgi:peptide/nickel transport system substrate-binding protein